MGASAFAPVLVLLLAVLLGACAHTDFYRNGQRIARFEGDMGPMTFTLRADGSITWSGYVSHSAATAAQGKAASDKITAIGAAIGATAGVVSLIP
jgi:hypothetical protein